MSELSASVKKELTVSTERPLHEIAGRGVVIELCNEIERLEERLATDKPEPGDLAAIVQRIMERESREEGSLVAALLAKGYEPQQITICTGPHQTRPNAFRTWVETRDL